MAYLALLLTFFAQSGDASFAGAEVSGSEVTAATMEVDVEVAVRGSDGPVVVHLLLPGEGEETKPLVRRTDRRWGALLELRRADWRVVFEEVASGAVSEEKSLTELGLDPSLLGVLPAGSDPPVDDDSSPALPAAVASFVGLVTLYAAWAVLRHRPGRHKS